MRVVLGSGLNARNYPGSPKAHSHTYICTYIITATNSIYVLWKHFLLLPYPLLLLLFLRLVWSATLDFLLFATCNAVIYTKGCCWLQRSSNNAPSYHLPSHIDTYLHMYEVFVYVRVRRKNSNRRVAASDTTINASHSALTAFFRFPFLPSWTLRLLLSTLGSNQSLPRRRRRYFLDSFRRVCTNFRCLTQIALVLSCALFVQL